jgi:hypothetical protein
MSGRLLASPTVPHRCPMFAPAYGGQGRCLIGDTFVPDEGLGEVIGVRPEVEVVSRAADSGEDFR